DRPWIVAPPSSGGRRRLHGMPQPHHAAIEDLARDEPERLPGSRPVTRRALIVHDALFTRNAVDSGVNQGAEFIDEPVLEKRAVDPAATLQKQLLRAKQRGDRL